MKFKHYNYDMNIHTIIPLDSSLFPRSEIGEYCEIIPKTLGRLIEHPCYDGAYSNPRIFEGDIIEVRNRHDNGETYLAIVVNESCITENGMGRRFPQDTTNVKVIGNVHDNPELIGEKQANLYLYYNGYTVN